MMHYNSGDESQVTHAVAKINLKIMLELYSNPSKIDSGYQPVHDVHHHALDSVASMCSGIQQILVLQIGLIF